MVVRVLWRVVYLGESNTRFFCSGFGSMVLLVGSWGVFLVA